MSEKISHEKLKRKNLPIPPELQEPTPVENPLYCSIAYEFKNKQKPPKIADAQDFELQTDNNIAISDFALSQFGVLSFRIITEKGNPFVVECERILPASRSDKMSAAMIQEVFGEYLQFPCFTHSEVKASLNKNDIKQDKTQEEATIKSIKPGKSDSNGGGKKEKPSKSEELAI